MVSMKRVLIGLCLTLLIASCTPAGSAPWVGPELSQPRDQLTVAELQQNRFLPLADMSYFARPDWAGEAKHTFSGSVSFTDTRLIFPKDIAYKLSYFVSCQARNWLQFTYEKNRQQIQKYRPAHTSHSGR